MTCMYYKIGHANETNILSVFLDGTDALKTKTFMYIT